MSTVTDSHPRPNDEGRTVHLDTAVPLPEIYYQTTGPLHWVKDAEDAWISVTENSARMRIKNQGFSSFPAKRGENSEVERCLVGIQDRQNVAYAGSLAGLGSGVRVIHGRRVLVTDAPTFVNPCPDADWPNLRAIIDGMLNLPNHDQRPYLFGWLKVALEAYRARRWQPGQVLALAGPIGSCKSLMQSVITELFGGRAAKPYLYMTGRTTFNADLFGAEHLVVEDEAESTDIRARRHFGSNIKDVAVNRVHQCHAKNRQALTLTPMWRMTISLNDEPARMLVLPPLDEDVADKVMLFKVQNPAMPMPTETAEDKERFWQTLIGELPGFVSFLNDYIIPQELRSSRFGILHFHHPELVEALAELTPETMLLRLIDWALRGTWDAGQNWEGPATELMELLYTGNDWRHCEAKKLLRSTASCGIYLARLAADRRLGGRVTSNKVHGVTIWTVHRPMGPELAT